MDTLYDIPIETLTFGQVVAKQAERLGGKTFIHNLEDGRKLTYQQMEVLSNTIANQVLANGIKPGDFVAVMMENCPEQILTYFALAKVGVVFVPINTAAKGDSLAHYLNDSGSIAVFMHGVFLNAVEAVLARTPAVKTLVLLDEPSAEAECTDETPAGSVQILDFNSFLEGNDRAPDSQVNFFDTCSIMYTSGTTGLAKGNIFTQAHTLTFGVASRKAHGITGDDTVYCALPLYHAGAWNIYTCGALIDGGSVALVRRFSASRFWQEISVSGSTVAFVTAVSQFLMNQPESTLDRDHGLRLYVAGPVPADPKKFIDRFGVALGSNYGLSDFCMTNALGPDDPVEKARSCGRTIPGCEVRIVNEYGFEVPPNTVGEITVRNSQPWGSTSGYFGNPAATAEARKDLWFHTGDMGKVDEDGYLWFMDRKKDALRRRGENISCLEVESPILAHERVREVAAYGVHVEEGMDDEVAVSVVLDQRLDGFEDELYKFCQDVLPRYMVPRFIEITDELPRTDNGKIRKVELRQRLEDSSATYWDSENVI